MRRLKLMVRRINKDIEIALWTEADLESANDFIRADPTRIRPGAAAYNTISQSLTFNLAVTLSRLLDRGTLRFHPNKRDVVSIPLMIRLLKQRRCQSALLKEAEKWTPHVQGLEDIHIRSCERGIRGAIRAYGKFDSPRANRVKHQRLRKFRNKRLAHNLMNDAMNALPTYDDLFLLLSIAVTVVDEARLAIEGLTPGLEDAKALYREQADLFWSAALSAEA